MYPVVPVFVPCHTDQRVNVELRGIVEDTYGVVLVGVGLVVAMLGLRISTLSGWICAVTLANPSRSLRLVAGDVRARLLRVVAGLMGRGVVVLHSES